MILGMARLLAEEEVDFLHVGDRFRAGNSSFSLESVLLVASIAAGVAGIVWLLTRWTQRQEQRAFHSPRKLWQELCRAHQVTWRESQMLRRIARREKLAEPCAVFLDPAYLERASDPHALSLRDRLFKKPGE